MLKVIHLNFLLVLVLLLGLLACNSVHELTGEEVLPQLSAKEVNTATQRRNKAILNISGEKLELNFNASRAVNTTCTQFHLPSSLSYKLVLKHLPDGLYTFKVTCFDAEGKPFAAGKQRVEINLNNPTTISIKLQPINNDVKTTFEENYNLWLEHKIESYSIIFKRSCFCIPKVTYPARVEVEQSGDVQITHATYTKSGEPVPPEYLDSFLSIEETFELIGEAIKEKADIIRVSYDSQYGFPTEVFIDYSEIIADDELYIEISNFNENCFLDSCKPPPNCQPYGFDSEEYKNAANTIELFILESFPIQVDVCLRSTHSSTCIEFIDIFQFVDASTFTITLKAKAHIPPDIGCGDALTPYAHSVRVDTSNLKTGRYTLIFLGTMNQKVSKHFYYQAGY